MSKEEIPTQVIETDNKGDSFLSDMSFRLRTPVNVVMGYTEILIEDAQEMGHTDVVSDLTKIQTASKQLLALVNHVVDSSKIENGKIVLFLETAFGANVRHELRTPVNAILGYSEMLMEDAEGTDLEYSIPDLERINTAGKNLLEDINEFFDPSKIITGDAEGTKKAAKKHDRDDIAELEKTNREIFAKIANSHILVVEDNDMNRDMLSRRLKRKGFSVTSTGEGSDTLRLINEMDFDLVLLDIVMPGANGLEIVKQVRRKYSLIDLPVIMVTAKDRSEDVVEALNNGANDYVTKPIDFPVAFARIQTQLLLNLTQQKLTQTEELYQKLKSSAKN